MSLQMRQTDPADWKRSGTAWLNPLRGTGRRAQRRRGVLLGFGAALVTVGAALVQLTAEDGFTGVGIAIGTAGSVIVVAVAVVKPIPKVTARAWMAGWWYARRLRRHVTNASGATSARARRSVTNKAAWAAQRQRDGRAARPEYGSSLRDRVVS